MILKHDELNNLIGSLPYDQYFDGIGLTDEQVDNRIAYANKMEEIMLWLFAIVLSTYGTDAFDVDFIKTEFRLKIEVLMLETGFEIDDYLANYLKVIPEEIVTTTVKHLPKLVEEPDEPSSATTPGPSTETTSPLPKIPSTYWTSPSRAVANAENEAETVFNYAEYIKAIADGKTTKKWKDVRDSHERVSHLNVGGKEIGIFDYFKVGDCLMRFPKDMENGTAEEICNCRCGIQYL